MRPLTFAAIALLAASLAFGDASVQQKTQVHFGGALGGVINAFGRGATHEGVTSDVAVRGDRKISRTGDSAEIIDLGQEKIYHLDYGRKTYSVVTFDQLRKQFEEQQARSQKTESRRGEKNEGPQYEVDFDVKSTGNHEVINGWKTHEEIATVTVHEKGKPIEKSGGFVLTADLWIGPHVAAMRELTEFDQRFMRKLYGETFDIDMRQMAAMMAMTPAFGKAMKAYAENASRLEGTPIRSHLTFDSVTGTESQQNGQQQESPSSALGSFVHRMRHRDKSDQEGPQHSMLFETTNEILSASSHASAEEVAIPAGFRER